MPEWDVPAFSSFLLAALVCGCGDERSGITINSPSNPPVNAVSTASDPVWMPGDSLIGINRSPIECITAGGVYHYVDSLTGWWTVRADGSDPTLRLRFSLPQAHLGATGLIAYERSQDRIGIIPLIGLSPDSTQTQLLPLPPFAHFPRWSPDGDSLVYITSSEVSAVASKDGQGERLVGPQLSSASWVPGQRAIVGVSRAPMGTGLGTGPVLVTRLNLTTLETDTLFHSDGAVGYPSYSADGMYLAFQRDQSDGSRIWISDANGANARQLLPELVLGPVCWSHQGHKIAYIVYNRREFSYRNGALWVVDVDTGIRKLVFVGGKGY